VSQRQQQRKARRARRPLFDLESRQEVVAPLPRYLGRIAVSVIVSVLLVSLSLFAGMAGYHYIEGLGWLDSFLNAAMILSGMGPVATVATDAGKLFAGLYAIYSGFVVLLAAGIVFAPIAHRLLHRFHVDEGD